MLPALPPAYAQELEVIVARGARMGELKPEALICCLEGAFGQISPPDATVIQAALHAHAEVATEALVAACQAAAVHLVATNPNAEPVFWPTPTRAHVACPGGLSAVMDFACTWLATRRLATPAKGVQQTKRRSLESCQITLDPGLSGEEAQQRGEARGAALLAALAERGLGSRPWFGWLGPPVPVDLLSPYLADLAPQLLLWEQAHTGYTGPRPQAPHSLRAPLLAAAADAQAQAKGSVPRTDVAALAHSLCAERPELQAERRAAERDHGIYAVELGQLTCHLVDLARTHPHFVDRSVGPLPPRSPWHSPHEAPVLVCVDWAGAPPQALCDPAREAAAMVQRLLVEHPGTCVGINVMHPGLLEHPSATTALLRGLASPSKVSQLTLAAPGRGYLPALSQQLASQGDTAVVGVADCATGLLPKRFVRPIIARGPSADTPPTTGPRSVGTAALGTLLAEICLAARQCGLLGRERPFHYALYQPSRGLHGVAAMAALMLQSLLAPASWASEPADAATQGAAEPADASFAHLDGAGGRPSPSATTQLPARPTPARGRGPLIRA